MYVILLLNFLCLFKLAQSRLSSNHNNIYICEESTAYFTILSSTLRDFLPPPLPGEKTSSRSSISVEEDHKDCEASAAVKSNWIFFCCRKQGADVVFLVQMSFFCMLSAFCALPLCLRSPFVKRRLPIL